MTTVAPEASLDLREVTRRLRTPLGLVLLAIVVAAIAALITRVPPSRPLDPRDASPAGARAVAELLRQRGVDVRPVAGADALTPSADETVVVADPAAQPESLLRWLAASPADLVVIAPDDFALRALAVPARTAGTIDDSVAHAHCALPAAAVAGPVEVSGDVYRHAPSITGCYDIAGADMLLVTSRAGGATTTVVGSSSTLTNEHLAREGNAALALGLLDKHSTVEWLVPQPAVLAAPDRPRKGLLELLPSRLLWALLQLLVVVLLLAAWRARRLGPLVAEPLPVVVRATETVEGRARLLRAARARGRAAAALRASSRARLASRLGLGPAASVPAVTESVSQRLDRPAGEVAGLLYGSEPADDAALVALADDLDRLEDDLGR